MSDKVIGTYRVLLQLSKKKKINRKWPYSCMSFPNEAIQMDTECKPQ